MAGTVVVLEEDKLGNRRDTSFPLEAAIVHMLARLHRLYNAGKLGPKFEATGPRVTIREMTDEDMERIFGVKKGGQA